MRKRSTPDNLVTLTSQQIADLVAKGFGSLCSTGKRLFRDDMMLYNKLLERRFPFTPITKKKGTPKRKTEGWYNEEARSSSRLKGRSPIRSQTGHDHDRNHHKG